MEERALRLCTINKKEIKIMKQIKKLASLLLAAVLAMTLLAGCGAGAAMWTLRSPSRAF